MTPQAANKQKGILYLERNRLQLYSLANPAILTFDIAPAIAHDIEIFNKDELSKQLVNFLKTNQLQPAEYLLILAQNVLFEKEFAPANRDEQKKFLDTVPFEYVSTKDYPSANGVRVVAANSDFYSAVCDIFQENGSSVEAVIPYFSVSPQMAGLDQNVVAVAINQFSQLKQNSLTPTKEPELVIRNPEAERKAEAKKKDNKTLIYTIPVFALLFGVLGFMMLKPASKPVTSNTQAVAPPPVISPSLPISPTAAEASPSASPAPITKATATVQITYDTTLALQAKALQDRLLQAGYAATQLNDGGTVSAPKPTMSISPSLPQDLKADIISVVTSAMPGTVTKDDGSITLNVVITIGK